MVKSRLQGAVLMAALGVAAGVAAAVAFAGTRGGLRGSPRSAKALHNQALIVAGGSPVPRLAPERTARAIEPHPDAPGYNPAVFVGVKPIAKIYELEPRVEKWAKPVETYLSAKISKELPSVLPGVQLKKIECKTACCRVDLEKAEGSAEDLKPAKIQQMLAVLYSPAAGGRIGPGLSYVLAYRGQTSWLKDVPPDDPEALFTAIEQRRAFLLQDLKAKAAAGKSIPYGMIDPRALPDR
jgi:hypothetical protein